MKLKSLLSAAAIAATAMMSLTSCGGLWTSAGVDIYPDTYYNDLGIYNPFYPTPPGSPWITPVYWGNAYYPSPVPTVRPTRPGNSMNSGFRPSGNSRPENRPVTLPDNVPVPTGSGSGSVVPPAGTFNPSNTTGGQPGVVMPPAGSGLRPASGRH